MNRIMLVVAFSIATVTAALGSSPAQACGEGQFNMGQGLRY